MWIKKTFRGDQQPDLAEIQGLDLRSAEETIQEDAASAWFLNLRLGLNREDAGGFKTR